MGGKRVHHNKATSMEYAAFVNTTIRILFWISASAGGDIAVFFE
jgi:hypothetical protein